MILKRFLLWFYCLMHFYYPTISRRTMHYFSSGLAGSGIDGRLFLCVLTYQTSLFWPLRAAVYHWSSLSHQRCDFLSDQEPICSAMAP